MKAILEFNLPEDKADFDIAVKAGEFHTCLYEFSRWLRDEIKYHEKEEYNPVSEKFYGILDEYGIDLWS